MLPSSLELGNIQGWRGGLGAVGMNEAIHIISLGAGVQSSAMSLMAAQGEIAPMPVAAIFADTQAEPEEVYVWLDWLKERLPFPVHTVTHKGGLTADIENSTLANAASSSSPSFFTKTNGNPEPGLLRRKCTEDFKVLPIKRKVKELLGFRPRQRIPEGVKCVQWIGISLDEMTRMRISMDRHIANRYPLVDLGIRRGGCLEWMKRNGYPEPPRSACVYCPYHSNREWRRLKDKDPGGWKEAGRVDGLIRGGMYGTKADGLFVHRECKPLGQVDLSTDVDHGQLTFLDECEGMCGV